MKNENYNLIKMLHNSLDDLWRVEKFYHRDSKKSKCTSCAGIYEMMKKDIKKHIDLLQKEIASHIAKKKFK